MQKLISFLNNVKLKGKFIGLVLPIIFITVVSILLTSIIGGKNALEKQIFSGISNTAELKAARINEFYERAVANLEVLAHSKSIQAFDMGTDTAAQQPSISDAFSTIKNFNQYHRISFISKDYKIKISTDERAVGSTLSGTLMKILRKNPKKITHSSVYKEDDLYKICFLSPVMRDDEVKAYLCIEIDMNALYEMIQDAEGLGETGETLIGIENETGALFLNPFRHDKIAALTRKAMFGDEAARPILEATQGKSGNGQLIDYRGKEVIAVWRYIPSLHWGLVTKIDVDEAFEPIYELRNKLILMSIFISIIGLIAASRFAYIITRQINNLREAMITIGQGNVLRKQLIKSSNDEVGEMIDQANNLAEFQKNIIQFTEEIGKGNFKFESGQDISKGDLGRELLKMKNNLQEVNEDEKKRNWATEGLAKFANILRNNNDDLQLLADDIIANVVKYLDANQGSVFIIGDDRKKPKMELYATYAYDRKKFAEKQFEMGEGLIGQCWQEKEKIFLTEIPDAYITITSGLGTANPTCILIMPLIINEEIYGILEIASFHILQDYQIDFVEKLARSIASTISSVKVNLHTSSLLEEAQQMSEELQAQEEELRQNAEEMQATQEEMERAQKELIKQEASLRAIIDNSEDTIFAINTDYEITVVNAKLQNKYKGLGIDLSPGRNILEVLPEDRVAFWKERYDRAMQGEKFDTEDEVSPGVIASVFHYPTYNETGEVTGVAVVSRTFKS